MNTSDQPLIKKTRRSAHTAHVIAPGQRHKLSNWLTDENHDINAFPDLFPNGRGGLNDSRPKKISCIQNYSQKMLNLSTISYLNYFVMFCRYTGTNIGALVMVFNMVRKA